METHGDEDAIDSPISTREPLEEGSRSAVLSSALLLAEQYQQATVWDLEAFYKDRLRNRVENVSKNKIQLGGYIATRKGLHQVFNNSSKTWRITYPDKDWEEASYSGSPDEIHEKVSGKLVNYVTYGLRPKTYDALYIRKDPIERYRKNLVSALMSLDLISLNL